MFESEDVSIKAPLLTRLEAIAEDEDMTINELVDHVLRNYVEDNTDILDEDSDEANLESEEGCE